MPRRIWMVALTAALCASCINERERLVQPRTLRAPDYSGGEALWAVAPLHNESGVSIFDPLSITDQLAGQIEQTDGLRALPLNRTLGAMHALGLASIDSPADARRLLDALGADALVVGTITSYDPYFPPRLGMSLVLFIKPGSMEPRAVPIADAPHQSKDSLADPVTLETSPVPTGLSNAQWLETPASTASAHLNGADQGVQMALRDYSEGRFETASALGWRRYLASMPLFTDFACYYMTGRLLDAESRRIGWTPQPAQTAKASAAAPDAR